MTALALLLVLQLCTPLRTQQVGSLPAQINEASGVALSRVFPGRVYHVNDSGSEGVIYATNIAGNELQLGRVQGFKPKDVEDLRLGPCGNGKDCLFIADIGDNDHNRRTIEVIVVEEPSRMNGPLSIRKRIRMRYPDLPHDAESLAVHPDGTILILTKNENGLEQLFRLTRTQWQNSDNTVAMLAPAGSINIRSILPNTDSFGIRPTSMDISSDGKRLLVLTYRDAIEFAIDIRKPEPLSLARRIPVDFLMQQEAVAYTPDGSSFIYTTEYQLLPAWIMKAACGK